MPDTKHRIEPASITCSDGVTLAGQWVLPFTDESSVTKAIALHPATGVDMNLYRKFAIYLAEHGWPALIYDFRGTGESAATNAKRDRTIRMSDWILYDVPAATAALKERFPNAKHVAIGHSVGAHGMLATQAEEPVDAMAMIASHAGITRTVKTAAERAKVWTIFNIVTPVCSRLMGYVPIDSLGIGKIIPLGVMTQWSKWSRKKQYFFDDPEFNLAERFGKATGPLLSVVFTDDLWANRRAVDVLTDRAVQYDVVKRDIEAGEGTKNGPIGHMGFYRSKNRALWPEVAAWVEAV
ncbi:alpha/beta fold hydrolase [Corynebacterium sp. 5QC2CO]|uniref:alpha/beta hydrolase family protein n=1 Tax=Corynebacterium sp. 5QC2CO TaxID=2968468 RepID=UPI00211C9FD0|nr:alpha/beta fold hydrolase [Corynebacterium sp. 5QC2CO]MCQ9350157.1 alpha/beta fold hydrolase [Corynebacterium sp. 5QC2CO]